MAKGKGGCGTLRRSATPRRPRAERYAASGIMAAQIYRASRGRKVAKLFEFQDDLGMSSHIGERVGRGENKSRTGIIAYHHNCLPPR